MPIAGTRAPLLAGWSGIPNPYSPTAGTRAPLLPKLPTRVSSTPTTAPVQTPQMTLEEWLRQESSKWLQAQIDAINAQKQAYLDDLKQQQDLEIQRGQALSQALQGMNIPGRIQQIYGNASSDIGGLAQAFSGELRDQATADAAQQTRMLSGTGQEGAVPNNGAALGDVLYGSQGYIPARNASETGAAFASQAALEPGFAQRIGQVKGADVYSQGLEGLKQFAQALTEVEAQRPQIEDDLYQRYQSAQEAAAPDLQLVSLADGTHQWFDKKTGEPYSNPFGPKKSSSGKSTNLQMKPYGDGYRAWNPKTGKWVGPVAPGRSKDSGTATLKTVNQGNKVSLVDPYTGKVVKTFTKTSLAAGAKAGKPKQASYGGYRYTFDDQGNIINQVPLQKAPGASSSKPKYTPIQISNFKKTAYNIAKSAAQGVVDKDGNPLHAPWKIKTHRVNGKLVSELDPTSIPPKQVLQDIMGEGVPFDIAVKAISKFFPAAKNWLKGKGVPAEKQTVQTASTGQVPKSDILPASWNPTHQTDGLGWGTKSAVDLFPGPPGTPVGSPVSGTILYYHPNGAQGGGSMEIRGDDGYIYWIGHVDNGVPGGRVNRGQQIAVVSSRHKTPHVHIDRRFVGSSA